MGPALEEPFAGRADVDEMRHGWAAHTLHAVSWRSPWRQRGLHQVPGPRPSRAARDCGPTGTLPSSAPAQGTSGGRRPAPLQGRGSRASPGQHWVHFLTWPVRKNRLTARRAAPPEAAFPVLSPLSTGGGSSTLYRSWCCRDTVLRCLKNMAGLLSFPLDKYLSHLLPLSHSLSEYTLHGNGSF